jgi:hypothetical protein
MCDDWLKQLIVFGHHRGVVPNFFGDLWIVRITIGLCPRRLELDLLLASDTPQVVFETDVIQAFTVGSPASIPVISTMRFLNFSFGRSCAYSFRS